MKILNEEQLNSISGGLANGEFEDYNGKAYSYSTYGMLFGEVISIFSSNGKRVDVSLGDLDDAFKGTIFSKADVFFLKMKLGSPFQTKLSQKEEYMLKHIARQQLN